jgi:hypothetical protein
MVSVAVMTSILGRVRTITATTLVSEPEPTRGRIGTVSIGPETLFMHNCTKSQARPKAGDRVLINVIERDDDLFAVEVHSGALLPH